MNLEISKILAFLLIFLLIANLILFALGKIGDMLFWVVIIVGAILAYFVMPKIKHGQKGKK